MLYYVSTTTLPRKKAHVIQQLNMCQAFSAAGEDVCYVYFESGDGDVDWDTISDYYGLSEPFELMACPAVADGYSFPVPYVPDMNKQLMTYLLIYKYLTGQLESGDILYSRNVHATRFFLRFLDLIGADSTVSVWFEQHQVDRGVGATFYEQLDGVVCISERQRRQILETQPVDPQKIFVAHDGVNLQSYETISTTEARQTLGFDIDEQIVMYTGHLYPSKDVETLVRAAESFSAECYIVGGYSEDIARIKRELSVPDNVTFTGFVAPGEVPLYQQVADILVATVAEETDMDFFSPLKLFEYQAAGKPLVVSQKPEYEEILTHGETGLFVPPESASALADSITTLLSDPELRTNLGNRAREHVVQYDWRNRARRVLQWIASTADGVEPTGTTGYSSPTD